MSDRAIYWLGGQSYRWIGAGFGAQMESFEWRRAPAGTQRTLCGFTFTVFQTHRRGLRIRHSWGLAVCGTLDELQVKIREFEKALRSI